jgi:NAD(P)-dependent dehydrogenase (short-subunit alcohol dehydrogenase family)
MSARYDLSGRVAIVTGGAGGLGRGIAGALCDAGATVELWDADAAALSDAVPEDWRPSGRSDPQECRPGPSRHEQFY